MSISTKLNQGESYAAIKRDLSKGQSNVLGAFRNQAYLTRRDLTAKTGFEICSLCGIIAALISRDLLKESGNSVQCPKTGRMVVQYCTTAKGDAIVYGEHDAE